MEWSEITKDTPLEEVKRIHQQIWDYAIEYGAKPDTPYSCDCAACEYALCLVLQKTLRTYVSHRELCANCPIDWGDEPCGNMDSLYSKWKHEQFFPHEDIMIEYAKQIRDIPFKYKLEVTKE